MENPKPAQPAEVLPGLKPLANKTKAIVDPVFAFVTHARKRLFLLPIEKNRAGTTIGPRPDELVLVVVGKRVLIQATSLYMYKLGSQTSQVVVYMKKAFQSEELFGDDKAGSRRPDWPAGARTVSDSMIEASSGGRCDSDYK